MNNVTIEMFAKTIYCNQGISWPFWEKDPGLNWSELGNLTRETPHFENF